MRLSARVLALSLPLFVCLACSEPAEDQIPPLRLDDRPPSPAPDAGEDIVEPVDRVSYELGSALVSSRGGRVEVFRIEDESDLLAGEVAVGQVGDYMIRNESARFVVEADRRVMNPCPFGGNVIDAAYGEGEDVLGEICLFLNAGQTLNPDAFEVVADGSSGGAGVLAVSGDLTVSDFINLKSMIDDFVPGIGDKIALSPDDVPPLRVTVYYVLRPGENGLRVVTALRNDGGRTEHVLASHLVASGGDGYYFNPLSPRRGYGYIQLGAENPTSDPLPYLGFVGERGTYMYVPRPDPRLQNEHLPVGGSYATIAGVAATLLGRADILQTILQANEETLPVLEGLLHVAPGETVAMEHWHFAGDRSLRSMLDRVYPTIGVETASLRGRVVGADGGPVPDARVTAVELDSDSTFNQAFTDADGAYEMEVPLGRRYRLLARRPGQPSIDPPELLVEADRTAPDLRLEAPMTIRVRARNPDGAAVPARLTVICETECPGRPTSREQDVSFHRLPSEFAAVVYSGVDGLLETRVPAGDYRLVVSRGAEWSVWPTDALESLGHPVSAAPGGVVELDAEIAHVVDTARALSADFHIHSISSPDSTVPHHDRVRNFMAEGVDVMVSTDHDAIVDYAPSIEELGAGDWITSVVGEEVTTSDLGHFNAFPLERDPDAQRGGAVDWGGGTGPSLTPAQLFAALDEHEGEQVIQMNHAAGLGLIKLTRADVLRGITFAPRERKRMPPAPVDPETGDTGLWSDGFTAMELYNGTSLSGFWELARWWMTMIGRGFTPTGTAVTDTHRLYSDLGGAPRSWVFVAAANDTPATFDQGAFVDAVNRGRVVGSNGPYFQVKIRNVDGDVANLGQTLETHGEPVHADVSIDVPAWMNVSRVDVYMNVPAADIVLNAGQSDDSPIPSTRQVPIALTPDDYVEVAPGHGHYTKQVSIELETNEDAWVVFVLHGEGSMYPILANEVPPFAFSNPIFLDADGEGYDKPPLLEASETLPPMKAMSCTGESCAMLERTLRPSDLVEAAEQLQCRHDHADEHRE